MSKLKKPEGREEWFEDAMDHAFANVLEEDSNHWPVELSEVCTLYSSSKAATPQYDCAIVDHRKNSASQEELGILYLGRIDGSIVESRSAY
ncbi:hypothetical protein AVEN_249986-1 [Araneus ventricosus]|uniref:Uncharacterized protein n=1 Tax=Araneus ventricosus TaxID=182803 RepID=A0A4Y2RZT2_ARAVE|nr:hypothetical protein AVEN_249986-1 [Araneus ventricosus]